MHKNTSSFLTVSVIALSFLFVLTPGVFAQRTNGLDKANARAEERVMQKPLRTDAPSTDQQRSCEVRQAAVDNRMSRLVELAEKIQENFATHSQRIQDYYLSVLVPKGVTIANYDDLLANIATKKAVVQTTLATAQAGANEFSCDMVDPQTYLNTFRTDMLAVKTALQDYRTSIKDLLVAVKTASEELKANRK